MTSLCTGVVGIKEKRRVMEAVQQLIGLKDDGQSDQAVAHWRLSLTGVCSCVSAGAEGSGGASHRQRRMIR